MNSVLCHFFSHVTLSLCQNVRNIIDSTYTNIITASMGQNYSFMHDMIFANRKLTEGTGIQPIRLLFTHRPIRSQMDAIWNVFTPKLTDFRHLHVIFPILSRIFANETVKVGFWCQCSLRRWIFLPKNRKILGSNFKMLTLSSIKLPWNCIHQSRIGSHVSEKDLINNVSSSIGRKVFVRS